MDTRIGPAAVKVTLAARAPGPLQALTERHADLAVDAFPATPYLLLRCAGPDDALDDARDALEAAGSVVDAHRASGALTLLFDAGEGDDPVLGVLADRAAHLIPPVRWEAGEARLTLLVDDGTDLRALAALFPEGRLLSKRLLANGAREAFGSPLLLPGLTAKQAAALVAAYDAGYYEFPRRATTQDVSRAVGVARSTFQEHLNRAERHVMRAMLPLVRVRAEAPQEASARARGEALAVYSTFSRELGLYIRLEILGGRVSGVQLLRRPTKAATASHPYLARILENVRTGDDDLADIPLHLDVTPFEREVLEFLRGLPRGTTMTYGEIARRLGRPGAARAVGQAVARNPVPLVIPCHRVLPAAGGVGGYSGGNGPPTKRRLLEREGALPAKASAKDRRRPRGSGKAARARRRGRGP